MKLAKYLNKNAVSIAQLSRDTGISRQTLYNYVKGKRTPTIESAWKIEQATKEVKVYDWLKPTVDDIL